MMPASRMPKGEEWWVTGEGSAVGAEMVFAARGGRVVDDEGMVVGIEGVGEDVVCEVEEVVDGESALRFHVMAFGCVSSRPM